MNIEELAKDNLLHDAEYGEPYYEYNLDQLTDFANAIIENYKASLVPVAIVECANFMGAENTLNIDDEVLRLLKTDSIIYALKETEK